MKKNFKWRKTLRTKVNHKGATVPVFKKVSANYSTWTPNRSWAEILQARRKNRDRKFQKSLKKMKEEMHRVLSEENEIFKDMKWVEGNAVETYYDEDGNLCPRLKT